MRRSPPLVAGLILLGALAGCSGDVECFALAAEDCRRVVDAANRVVPPGHTRLVVDASGPRVPPYSVFACYPNGSQVVVEVSFPVGGARVEPLEGVELASCD